MALFLIISSWLFVISIVVALCVSARRGDEHEERRAGARAAVHRPQSSPVAVRRQSATRSGEGQLLGADRTAA
ncbi:MAG TPA: hypothetical protein VGO14_04205 [Solirubrobacteraceae bacterium]|jgi:hypothetical protein|nr:hypothetical protein [Solirubrobacteraceae bacterium]